MDCQDKTAEAPEGLGVSLQEMARTVRFFKFAQPPALLGCFAILGSNCGHTKAGKTGDYCLSSEGIQPCLAFWMARPECGL
jgi:hypothetical protein